MNISIKEAMENDGRLLRESPIGTRITGVYSKDSGREVLIEKRDGYRTGWGLDGAVGRRKFEEWAISGSSCPYIKSTLRAILNGTSKYYTM